MEQGRLLVADEIGTNGGNGANEASKVKAKIQNHAASPLAPFKSRRYQKNKRTAQEEKLYQQIIIKEGLETVMGKLTRGVEI